VELSGTGRGVHALPLGRSAQRHVALLAGCDAPMHVNVAFVGCSSTRTFSYRGRAIMRWLRLRASTP
jgi:hypothetical protein